MPKVLQYSLSSIRELHLVSLVHMYMSLQAIRFATMEQVNIDPYNVYTQPCNNISLLRRNLKGRYVSYCCHLFYLPFTEI